MAAHVARRDGGAAPVGRRRLGGCVILSVARQVLREPPLPISSRPASALGASAMRATSVPRRWRPPGTSTNRDRHRPTRHHRLIGTGWVWAGAARRLRHSATPTSGPRGGRRSRTGSSPGLWRACAAAGGCRHAPPICPIPGRVTARERSLSPTRIAGGRPLGCLLRSRNDGTAPFLLEAGKPTRLPRRFRDRESDQAAQRPPAVHGGFLEHLLAHLGAPRQAGHHGLGAPVGSTANTRPASSVFFHALNALIRSNPVHGTSTSGSRRRSVSAVFTSRRHWLNANRAAPACRATPHLLDRRVEAEPERGVPGHRTRERRPRGARRRIGPSLNFSTIQAS